jgi:hypothetical protein
VPFWPNTASVGLNPVVALFRLRNSEIVLLSTLMLTTFWPMIVPVGGGGLAIGASVPI